MPHFLSSECKHLLISLLKLNPLHRLTIREVLQHPWITQDEENSLNIYSLMEQMMDNEQLITKTDKHISFCIVNQITM